VRLDDRFDVLRRGLLTFAKRTEDVKHGLSDHVDRPDDETGEYGSVRVERLAVCVCGTDLGPSATKNVDRQDAGCDEQDKRCGTE